MQTEEKLIRKLFLNQCTRVQLEHLLQLIREDQSEEGPEIMTELFRQLGTVPDLDETISNRIYKMVEKDIASLQRKLYWWVGRAVAAALLLLCSMWVVQYVQSNKDTIQIAAYGEVRELFLPDSSLVVLNGNSSIIYKKNWQKGRTRIVRLAGEAYFKVRKKPTTQAKFQVVTNDLTVEVLGTAFNVNAHKNETRIFLEEGKVKINLDHQLNKVVNLAPGETMRYSAIDQKLTPPKKAIEEQQPNWRAGFLQFKETPLHLIFEKLSQAHKLEFVITDKILAETQFTITLPTEDMHETMELLGKTIGAHIFKEDSRYMIDLKPK